MSGDEREFDMTPMSLDPLRMRLTTNKAFTCAFKMACSSRCGGSPPEQVVATLVKGDPSWDSSMPMIDLDAEPAAVLIKRQ